ncbi:Protein FAM136A [Glycine soja]
MSRDIVTPLPLPKSVSGGRTQVFPWFLGADLIVDSKYQMDHFAAHEEQLASLRMRQKFEEVNVAAQTNLAPVQDYVNFTLQKAYFMCAYECFDRSKRQEEISSCVENCSIPLSNVQHTFDHEMAQFQERLNRSLMVCQDKYEAARLQKKNDAMNDFVSCADQSIQENIKTLPHLANKLKASFGIRDNGSS